jgi:hypothetical protein
MGSFLGGSLVQPPQQAQAPNMPGIGASYPLFGDPGAGAPGYLSGDLSKSNPLPWQQYMPGQITDSTNPNSIVSQQLTKGPEYFQNTLNNANVVGSKQPMFNQNFTGSGAPGQAPSGQNAAIAQSAEGNVDRNQMALQTNAQQASPMLYSQMQGQAGSEMGAAQNLALQNFQAQYQFQLQRQNLYNQWRSTQNQASLGYLNSLTGGLGSMGSMMGSSG